VEVTACLDRLAGNLTCQTYLCCYLTDSRSIFHPGTTYPERFASRARPSCCCYCCCCYCCCCSGTRYCVGPCRLSHTTPYAIWQCHDRNERLQVAVYSQVKFSLRGIPQSLNLVYAQRGATSTLK